jgi:hypothetical protein
MSGDTQTASSARRIDLRVPARDFSRDWRRYNLVANYVAEYASYFFEHKDRAENVISSVLYELLEHMAGISREDAEIALRLVAREGRLIFEIATSGASYETLGPHQELVAGLARGDLTQVYRRLLESEAEGEGHPGELGLAMLAHDYGAELSTTVDPAGAVTLSATIGQEEMNP